MPELQLPFHDVPHGPRGHLGLLFYAAAFHLIFHLRRRAGARGEPLDLVLKDYPFLGSYFSAIRERLPDEIGWGGSMSWLREHVEAWEQSSAEPLPLVAMRRALSLPFEGELAFVLAGVVEEEAQFAELFAALQQPRAERRATLDLMQQVFQGATEMEPWLLVRPLINAAFLQVVNPDAPKAEWVLRVPPHLWNAVRGESAEWPLPGVRFHPPESLQALDELVTDPSVPARLAELRELSASGRASTIVLRGMPGTDRLGAAGAIAKSQGRGLMEVECTAATPAADARWRSLAPLCTLAHAMPAFSIEAGPGETFEMPALDGYRGPATVLIGREGGIGGETGAQAVTLHLDLEPPGVRLEIWKRALNGRAAAGICEIASAVCLPGRYIRQCARLAADYAAIERRPEIAISDIRQAARAINRQALDTLASRIDGPASWAQLIVDEATLQELRVLENRCRHRERLAAAFQPYIPGGMNRGVRTLFEGPSGAGKTLAARVLASELGLDLYRVDLAAVVNKYIGETEKNLSRVLSRAEDLNVILLLDEGDSLMTRRTDVKSSNDRYANLETNYLLQRLESYTGVVIVTTNAGQAIDSAFRRRMDVVIKFHLPSPIERWRLWQAHLPPGHTVSADVLEEISLRYELTGGQIRNTCVRAALLSLANDGALRTQDLREALQAEHRKAGATFIDQPHGAPARNQRTIASFLGGLS